MNLVAGGLGDCLTNLSRLLISSSSLSSNDAYIDFGYEMDDASMLLIIIMMIMLMMIMMIKMILTMMMMMMNTSLLIGSHHSLGLCAVH